MNENFSHSPLNSPEPGDAEGYFERGNGFLDAGAFERAIAACSPSIRLNPGAADAYSNRGRAHRGACDTAVAGYTPALRLDPAHARAYDNRGPAHLHRGEYARAVADHPHALRLEGPNPGSLNNRGNAYRHLGAYAKAVADFDGAIALDPEDPLPWYNRGLTHCLMSNYAKAVADFAQAALLDPTDTDAPNELAWLRATCPRVEYRQGIEAVEYAQQVCQMTDWQDAACLDTLAAAYAECGKYDEAVRWRQRALALAEPEERAGFQARLALYEAGRPYRDVTK